MAGRLCRLVASEIACKSAVAKAVLQKMIVCKQGEDVHTAILPQMICFQGIAFLSKIAYTIFEQNAMH